MLFPIRHNLLSFPRDFGSTNPVSVITVNQREHGFVSSADFALLSNSTLAPRRPNSVLFEVIDNRLTVCYPEGQSFLLEHTSKSSEIFRLSERFSNTLTRGRTYHMSHSLMSLICCQQGHICNHSGQDQSE